MMTGEAIAIGIASKLKYAFIALVPFVEPQLAGMLGSLAYLIVRHELKMASLALKSFVIVVFFGWIGAWVVVNLLAEYCADCPHVWEQLLAATAGFLSYDAMMALGANSSSVVGWLGKLIKDFVEKRVGKWN